MLHFRNIVNNKIPYLAWKAGLLGRRQKTVLLRTGERLVMRPPPSSDSLIATEVFLNGDYIPLVPIPDDIEHITDLGGNVGYTAIFLARRFPKARLDVFEPHPAHLQQLGLNIGANFLDSRVVIHPCAAGCKDESLFLSDAHARSTVNREAGISVAVIDWLDLAAKSPIDLLKMDVEGTEYDLVYDPRFASLRIPYIVMEYHRPPGRPDISERLRSMGYTVTVRIEKEIPGMRLGILWARHIACLRG